MKVKIGSNITQTKCSEYNETGETNNIKREWEKEETERIDRFVGKSAGVLVVQIVRDLVARLLRVRIDFGFGFRKSWFTKKRKWLEIEIGPFPPVDRDD